MKACIINLKTLEIDTCRPATNKPQSQDKHLRIPEWWLDGRGRRDDEGLRCGSMQKGIGGKEKKPGTRTEFEHVISLLISLQLTPLWRWLYTAMYKTYIFTPNILTSKSFLGGGDS